MRFRSCVLFILSIPFVLFPSQLVAQPRKPASIPELAAYTVSSAALADLIASGEIGASPQIFRNHAMVSAERGSAVGWVPMELVPTNAGSVALAAHAPHPHGALLLVEFLLSDAPKVLDKFNYGHPASDYGFKRWYQDQGRSVEDYEKDSVKWGKLAREISQR